MKKKSPYKAAKSSPKATYSTKKLSPKTNGGNKSLTKQEKAQARILARKRAQEWAKKELGKKKAPSPADSPSVIVIDDDDDDVKDDHKMCVDNKRSRQQPQLPSPLTRRSLRLFTKICWDLTLIIKRRT